MLYEQLLLQTMCTFEFCSVGCEWKLSQTEHRNMGAFVNLLLYTGGTHIIFCRRFGTLTKTNSSGSMIRIPLTLVVRKEYSLYSGGQNTTFTDSQKIIGVMLLALPNGVGPGVMQASSNGRSISRNP